MNKTVENFSKYVAMCAGLKADRMKLLDYDLDRVCFSCAGTEYTIRMWNVTNEEVRDYTLYRMVSDGKGCYGEAIYRGEHYQL